ncbi:hypothetical Protein YC6258_02071 [Gynuella sunshinyii YC6258]|uniref:Uncharacterized protein n=1 Tax=Gynuella sunshinyii YC6258 TaxID=1445510 RepID=A0A0C5V3N6_9GAMM|nr:hypothetical Protein YC6258_02071 [Gynuella sunshinyii YC6258]
MAALFSRDAIQLKKYQFENTLTDIKFIKLLLPQPSTYN